MPVHDDKVPSEPSVRVSSSTSTFRTFREMGFVFVDKTPYIERMIATDDKFLVTRPPKFGKTVMLTTMAALFNGEKHLFDGSVGPRLAIADTAWNWENETHTVLHIDMSAVARRKAFRENLIDVIARHAIIHGLTPVDTMSLKGATRDLIQGAAQRSPSGKVVVLIDEYDAPIAEVLRPLTDAALRAASAANRQALDDFMTALKGEEAHIRFQLVTGTGETVMHNFPEVIDATFDERFGALCGYTMEEIHVNFQPQLNALQHRLKV